MFDTIKLFSVLLLISITKCDDELIKLQPFELNDFLKGTYLNKGWNATWISGDSLIYTLDVDKSVYLLNVKNNKEELLFDSNVMERYPGSTFVVSNDEKFVLIRYNVQAIFRHSTTAQYAIYSIADKEYYDIQNKKHIQIAQWSPTGSGLIYVFENDIYYLQEPGETSNPKRFTKDGIPGVVYNGVPDWVYEEEVLASGSALWFSPDGNYVAFAQFNDTLVREYSYLLYGSPGNLDDQYPKTISIRYPKAGETNPIVHVKVIDLMNDEGSKAIYELNADAILYAIKWSDNDHFTSVLMNRVQNKANLYKCDMAKNCVFENYDLATDKGWIVNPSPIYNSDGDKYILTVSQPEDNDYFKHLILVNGITDKVQRLTYGKRIVTDCLGWDLATNNVYYVSSVENKPSQQQVYVVNVDTLSDKCITCDFQTPEGFCKYSSASFSKDFTYYAKICNGPGPNFITIDSSTSYVKAEETVWENNNIIREQMATLLQPLIKDVKVNISNGYTADVRLLLPPNFDETKKYPMVVEVYAGPDSNQITDIFSLSFKNYIVTNRNYIYAFIDGRGSGRRGDNILFEIYRRLGTVEIEDQISVTKHLQENYKFIDKERTGIWGWSYGGFSTAWVLVKDIENVFKFGLSVAPVTDFIYYDSIYTERYMGLPTPDDNEFGYNNTDITRNAESFKNKLFFLIHGNADDNVHYQQSMLLAKALEYADVMFQQLSYPDENHSLMHVSPHLYHSIDRFWARCFGLPDPKNK